MWASTGPHNGREGLRRRCARRRRNARLWKALAESADAYAHHQAPPTANDEDDELARFKGLGRRVRGRAAAPRGTGGAPPCAARRRRHSTTRPTCLGRAGPRGPRGPAPIMDTRTSTTFGKGPRGVARGREIDARRRRGLAAARSGRAARLAAAAPPAAPPAPPGRPRPASAGARRRACRRASPASAAPSSARPVAAFLDGAGMGYRPLPRRDPDPGGLPPADGTLTTSASAARRRRAPPAHGRALRRERARAALVGSRTLPTSDGTDHPRSLAIWRFT